MAIITMKLPDLGEGVAEAELVEWNIAIGDRVSADDTLATVMTDKAAMEIPAPSAGVVTWRAGEPGDMLRVGSDLVRIDTEATAPNEPVSDEAEVPEPDDAQDDEPDEAPHESAPSPPPPEPDRAAPNRSRARAAPAVRKRAAELGIDLSEITGTGPEGRITHDDLTRTRKGGEASDEADAEENITEIKLTGLRRMTAERVAASKATIPHFTIVEEVDVTDLEALRATLNERYADDRSKLTVLPFVLRALVVALRDHSGINGHFDGDEGVLRLDRSIHAGIATQTQAGLMVPVLRHVERLGLWQCAAGIARVAERARQGRASREELTGSTITVTSLGILGGIASTPIINAPELAIIGVNRITKRPVWRKGKARPRKIMNLSCSFDHRVIDGWDAAVFLHSLRDWLESPAPLLVEEP